ncbi:MAG: universal stress protein [Pseudomonadota bacterium]
MFEKIVVALDGSEPSENALGAACGIAEKFGSELYLVHAPQIETTAIAVGSGAVEINPDPQAVAAAGEKVMGHARETAAALGCTPAGCFVGKGEPADEIIRHARDVGADLIVMGRRGLGGIAGLFLGSVSQKVSHGAGCTCLTVHH